MGLGNYDDSALISAFAADPLLRYFSSITTGPDTGSVSPSSVSRNVSSVAIMCGRAAAMLGMGLRTLYRRLDGWGRR